MFFFFAINFQHLYGQEYPHRQNEFEFIKEELNEILFYGDTTAFLNFFENLDHLLLNGEGQIKIVHIGGSHIQADIISGQIRKRLQTLMPGLKAGRGFLFPYLMAGTNNPSNYTIRFTGHWDSCKNVQKDSTCLLGLSGLSVTTTDSLTTIGISPNTEYYLNYDFSRIKVFHPVDSTSFSIRLDQPDSTYTISINQELGYTEFTLDPMADSVNLVIVKTAYNQKNFQLLGISLESDDPGFIYNAIGVNGADLPAYLSCELLPGHLKALSPDVLILSIGINDAYNRYFDPKTFSNNYDSLIARIKSYSPDVRIIFTTNNDSYYRRNYPNRNGEIVMRTIKQMAPKYDAGIWDLFSIMGGLGSIKTWETFELAKSDKIHFTRKGYELLGDLFYSALMKAYERHFIDNTALQIK